MAHICLGEACRRPQQQEIPLTPNLTDENTIAMPFVSNDLLDTETVSDQDNQASPPSPIHVFSPYHHTLPTSPAYSSDSQASPYSPTSISIHLEPQSSSSPISLPILLDGVLPVIPDPQQHQPSLWVPILPIPNHFKLHPHSYIYTTIDHLPNAKNLEVVQQFLNKPTPTSQ